jgi:hypothetical protein
MKSQLSKQSRLARHSLRRGFRSWDVGAESARLGVLQMKGSRMVEAKDANKIMNEQTRQLIDARLPVLSFLQILSTYCT